MDKAQAIANAEAMGMELNEYLDLYQVTLEEGKTEDPQETTPPVDQNQTPAGDSSSGDISLESPEVKPIDKALARLGQINVSDEYTQLVESVDEVEQVPVMRETAKGLMEPTGEFFERRAYDEYLEPAKNSLGEGATEEDIVNTAKSMYLKESRSSLINSKVEEIMEDFDDEVYTPLGRLKKYYYQATLGTDISEGGIQRAQLAKEVEKSRERAYGELDRLSKDMLAQEAYLETSAVKLNEIAAKNEKDPTSITQEDIDTFNNLKASYDNVFETYKTTTDSLASTAAKGRDLEEIVDLTARSYDNLDVAASRVGAAALNAVGGLAYVAKELSPEQIMARVTGQESTGYVPMYIPGGAIDPMSLGMAGDELTKKAEELTNKVEKRQALTEVSSVEDFLEFGLDLFTEQAVNTAVTASIPGAGLGLIAASASGTKFKDMEVEMENGEKITPLRFYTAGLLYGAGEYVTEKVSLGQFVTAKKALKKSFDIAATPITQSPMTTVKALGKWGTGLNQEGLAELGSQVIGNFADKYVLDKDQSLWDGIGEAYFSGAVMSGLGFGAPGLIKDVYSAATTGNEAAAAGRRSARVIEIKNKIDNLQMNADISDPAVQEAVGVLQEEADALLMENLSSMKAAEARLDDLSKSDKRILLNVDSQIYKAKGAVDRINSNENLSDAEKKNLIKKHADDIYKLELRKEDILGATEASKGKARAKVLQMKLAADKDLKFTYVNGANAEEAVSKAIEQVEKSDLDDDKKSKLIDTLKAQVDKEMNGFYTGAELGFPISITTEEGAKRNASVAAHEVSHATLFKKLIQGDADMIGLATDLRKYLEKNYGEIARRKFANVDAAYKGEESDADFAEEIMAAAVELSRRFDLKTNANKTLTGKLMSRWNKINEDGITEIKTGKDVLAAIESFNASFDSGDIKGLTKKIFDGQVKARVAKDMAQYNKDKSDVAYSVSNAAERAKQVLEKVSSNMDFFDPNSPLIARVLPGMIEAQLVPYINKGLKVDKEEAVSDVLMRLYAGGEIGKYNGKGTLYGYLNGRIKYRILDAFKNNSMLVEDFAQSDVEDLKGAAADVTTIEQTEERVEAERPTYKTLTERKVVDEEVMETIKAKLPRIVGTLKNKIDAPVSKNKTVTPLVNELRLALGKQIDIDLKTAMGGKKDGQLRKWLQKNRKAILENMTTTYLMTAMPNAIQKKVDGVWTSDWAGKKIDRESVATDNAGRTSGAEMVRRLPQASLKISEADFLANILEPSGNPIRGRKESLAKAIAEELAIEMVNAEMQNPESKVYEAFTANQERLEAELTDSFATKLALDFERGNVKFSKTFNRAETEQKNVQAALRAGIKYITKDGINVIDLEEDGSVSDHNFAKIKTFLLKSDPSIEDVDREKLYGALVELEKAGALDAIANAGVKSLLKESNNAALKDLFPSYTSLAVLQETMTTLASAASNKNLAAEERLEKSKQLEELRTELAGYENSMIGLVAKLSPKELSRYGVGSIVNKLNPDSAAKIKNAAKNSIAVNTVKNIELAQSYISGEGIASKLFELQKSNAENKGQDIAQSGLLSVIQSTNIANKELSSHIAKTLIVAHKKGELSLKDLVRFLQAQGSYRKGGFAAHGQLTYFTLENFQSGAKQKIEHVYPNLNILMGIAEIAADENITLNSFNEAGADITNAVSTLLDANTLWADNNDRTDYIDTAGRTNTSGLGRFAAIAKEDRANIYSTTTKSATFEDWVNGNAGLETLEDHIAKKEEVEKYDIRWDVVSKSTDGLKPSVKFSKSAPRAVFMVGAPGSGKSSVLKGLGLIDKGYRLINQDPYLEKFKKEANLPADEKQYTKEQLSMRAKLGWKARKAAEADLANYTASKESMVVDGTGASYNATTKKMKALEAAGFEIHMVHVKTTKETAKARNNARSERSLMPFIVSKTWASVQESAAKYQEDYGNRFYELQADDLAYGEALPKEFVDQVNNGLEASSVKFSKSLNMQFNEMIERNKGIAAMRTFSSVQAKMLGEKIGKYRLFLPASAEDFRGLTAYTFAGKGKQGEADQKFFEENIIDPYVRGVAQIDAVKQQIRREYHAAAKANKPAFKMLGKKISNTKFTYDQALRVYLWTQQGVEIPGMDKDDTAFLINEINQYPQLIELGNAMMAISRQDTWIEPNEHWMGHTLVSELNSMTEKVGRKKYLEEFISNVDAIFSGENLNKIEAIYGSGHREAMEDAIYSMKNGRNRPSGANKQMNQWSNWVNNSTGAIMFFNIRSAVLQTLSATNFINWSDNNPAKAAMAFANQKQYWSDFALIFNSDKLKQRRSGLQTDVNAAEIANQAEGAQNKASAVVSYLLKIGFTPTQMADSFAIGMGGAAFYRNRVNTYLKEGMSKEEAETKAFADFSKTADEAQQSSDPYLVSQEQRSPLGRLVLAFQNTPMQYTRLMKKASQDLIAGRGDAKTHISKIIYYGAVQNFVFSALQSALFAMIPGLDDDEELDEKELAKKERKEDEKVLRIVNSMTDSILKGSGVKGAVLATIKNTITEYFKQEEKGFTADHTYTILQAISLSPPIGSKARKIYSSIQSNKFSKDVLEAEGFNVMSNGRVNLSPAYSIIGSLVSGVANVPMDRLVDIISSYSEALDERNKTWQRIALALGWKTWDVGAKNEEHDLIKAEAKAKRKEEGKIKAKKTRESKKKQKQDNWEAEQMDRLMNPNKYK